MCGSFTPRKQPVPAEPCVKHRSSLDGAGPSHRNSVRATTATLLLDTGVDITTVQELLGHRERKTQ